MVDDSAGNDVDEILDGLRRVVETRARGQDNRSGLRNCGHISQVDQADGGFSGDEDEPPPLLEAYVRGPFYQAARNAVGDSAENAARTRDYRHAVDRVRAAGDRRGHVLVMQQSESGL